MLGPLARQVCRKRFSAARLVVARFSARRDCARFVFGLLGADLILCHALLELAEQELELLDLAVELLRGAAEARPPQHRELRLEMLDLQRLRVKLGIAHRDQTIALGELHFLLCDDPLAFAQQLFPLDNHPPQRTNVARKCGGARWHARYKNLIRVRQSTQHIVS